MTKPPAVSTVVVGVDGSGRSHALTAGVQDVPVVAVDPSYGAVETSAAVAEAASKRAVLVADDAHLLDPEALGVLAAAARAGMPVRFSRRPVVTTAELADLEAAVLRDGTVLELAALSGDQVATLMARVSGRPVDPGTAEAVHAATGGLPALVVGAVVGDGADLRSRVDRQLARCPEPAHARTLAGLLAVAPRAPDPALAQAAGLDRVALAELARELADAGLTHAGPTHAGPTHAGPTHAGPVDATQGDGSDGRLVPVVAEAVLARLTPAERRALHERLAEAMLARDDVLTAAEHLRAAGEGAARAATIYAAAAERVRFTDPAAALGWFELASLSGAGPETVGAGAVETSILLGRPTDTDIPVVPEQATRLAIASGVAAAHQGRNRRAADLLLAAGPPGPVLAVPTLVAVGRLQEAQEEVRGASPTVPRLLAQACLALADPRRAVPQLIEAAEAFEAAPDHLLPDTPHAIAAITAVAAGDLATVEHLLGRVVAGGQGGPLATTRHRLLLAWVRLRAGDQESARQALGPTATADVPGRERMLIAALTAALAHRSGEVSSLREAWHLARPALARRAVDLLVAELVEELLVAAARIGEHDLVADILGDLDAIVEELGRPAAWRAVLGWCRLNVAIAGDDVTGARRARDELAEARPETNRGRAQMAAAAVWAEVLAERVDGSTTEAAVDLMVAAGMPWEASRLCGQAAIRTTDPGVARRLLERARALTAQLRSSVRSTGVSPGASTGVSTGLSTGPSTGGLTGGPPVGAPVADVLSEREQEVARMVLAGETYKAIGAQLFLSPKTVEHHVARIRNKLGASSRAELLASLRSLLS